MTGLVVVSDSIISVDQSDAQVFGLTNTIYTKYTPVERLLSLRDE